MRIRDAIHWYEKANNKCLKDYDKNKESSFFNYWDVNNLYGWTMSQKLSANNFEWIKHVEKTVNPSIKVYINKAENRIRFKTGHYLELLTPATMKLLGSTKRR